MPSLKEKHFSKFHTNICTLLFVIIFQVNIWSSVKSIHTSLQSHFHFIINFEEHYFKCKHDLWDHMLPLSSFPVLLFFPKHSVKFTWSWEMELLPTHITWTLWIMMCVTAVTLNCKTWCAGSCSCKTSWNAFQVTVNGVYTCSGGWLAL